jgi:hypothetical protein
MDGSVMTNSIHDVKKKHEHWLIMLPGVVSVGIGKTPEGKSAIIVGLDRHRKRTVRKIPKEVDGFTIRIEIIGPLRAQ